MKAVEARALKVGDFVGATFGNYHKKQCEILAINWPVFTLRWKDSRGEWQTRTRRYPSMYPFHPQNTVQRGNLPAWLKYEVSN
jgi:hypothetical protein